MDNNNNDPAIGNMDIDSTLEELSRGLRADETLVLDLEHDNQNQTDVIYDTLVLKGFSVIRDFIKGKSIIIINKNKKHNF